MDVPIPSLPGASALRESFGDNKIDITRKITACVACRRQKVKCHMPDGQSRCTRCRKRNLPCAVNRSLQTLLEEDATWKNTVVQKLRWLEETMTNVTAQIGLPEAQNHDCILSRVPPARGNNTVATLGEITQYMHGNHLLVFIAEGLERLLRKCQQEPVQEIQGAAPHVIPQVEQQHAVPQFDMSWMECMASFDFHTHPPDLDERWFQYSTSVGHPVPQQ